MATGALKTQSRDLNLSKGELNASRKAGKIPGCIFGKGMETIPIFVDLLSFKKTFSANGKIFETEVNGESILTNAKEIQTHSFGNYITHIGFHKLKKGEKTTVNVPVQLIGECKGLKAGGILTTLTDMLSVNAIPSKLPSSIDIDVTELEVGSSIKASDISLPDGASFTDSQDMESVLVTCNVPQKQEEVTTASATEEAPAEGAEAPAAEGDKKAE